MTVTLYALRDPDMPRRGCNAIEVPRGQVRYLRDGCGLLVRKIIGRFTRPGRFRVASLLMVADEWGPRHALDLPEPPWWSESEWYAHPGAFLSRRAALQAAAGFNRHWLWVPPGDVRQWRAVVEIGDPLPVHPASTYAFGPAGGFEVAAIYRPLRLVRPSDDEIKRYAREYA